MNIFMKKKLFVQMCSLFVVFIFLFQLSTVNTFGAEITAKNSTLTVTNAVPMNNDFIGTLQRSIFYGLIIAGDIPNHTKSMKLTSFAWENGSDFSVINASFKSTSGKTEVRFSMSMTFGTKSAWEAFTNSKEYKEGRFLNFASLFFGWVSYANPSLATSDAVTQMRNTSTLNLFNSIDLKTSLKRLSGDDLLVLVPSYNLYTYYNGNCIDIAQSLAHDAYFPLSNGELPDLPEGETVPDWVYNGVTA